MNKKAPKTAACLFCYSGGLFHLQLLLKNDPYKKQKGHYCPSHFQLYQ